MGLQDSKEAFEVTFGKDRYHMLEEMQSWCRKYIGVGGYLQREDSTWKIETMFGNSTFTFKQPKHLTLFVLKWGAGE